MKKQPKFPKHFNFLINYILKIHAWSNCDLKKWSNIIASSWIELIIGISNSLVHELLTALAYKSRRRSTIMKLMMNYCVFRQPSHDSFGNYSLA